MNNNEILDLINEIENEEIEEEVKLNKEELLEKVANNELNKEELIELLKAQLVGDKANNSNNKKKKEKVKLEVSFPEIILSDKALFMENISVDAEHTKETIGGITTFRIKNVSEKEVRRIKNKIASNKIKYETGRMAKNTGLVISGTGKGVLGGLKGFGLGVKQSFEEEVKKMY